MANEVKKVKKVVSRGEQNLLTQRLNSDFSAYEGDPVKWQGESAFVFTPAQTTTELASGNNPAWDVIRGVVTGDVELTIYDIPLENMEDLFGVKYSAADGVCVGDTDDQTVWLGLSIEKLIRTEGVDSVNKVILYKVCFDLPAIDIKTITKDDNGVSELKLKGKAYPVFYKKANGNMGSRTYALLNSVTQSAKFEANKNAIAFPAEVTREA